MAATNGPDNSLERIIVLYQQELHNKLQSLNTIQQRYQLLNSQLQQLNKQEDQSYACLLYTSFLTIPIYYCIAEIIYPKQEK